MYPGTKAGDRLADCDAIDDRRAGGIPRALDSGLLVSIALPLVTANQVSTAFGALSDPTRRAIFERLAGAPAAVGDLARDFPVSRPAVSQHLRVLKDAGLVTDRAHGTRRIYQVHPPALEALRTYLDAFWTTASAA